MDDGHDRRRAEAEADVEETRDLSPSQRLERLADLLAAITPIARQSPHWDRFSEPVPRPPHAERRWRGLIRQRTRDRKQ